MFESIIRLHRTENFCIFHLNPLTAHHGGPAQHGCGRISFGFPRFAGGFLWRAKNMKEDTVRFYTAAWLHEPPREAPLRDFLLEKPVKKSPVVSSSITTRDGDTLSRRPMATYVDPSQRAVIRDALPSIERDRRDGIVMLRPADYLKPEAHAMSDITIFFIGLTAGLVSSGLVFLALNLGGLL